jgi:hypothetical protein
LRPQAGDREPARNPTRKTQTTISRPSLLPATSAEFEFIRINSISTRPEPEGNPPAREPEVSPTDQSGLAACVVVATLTEPICPFCGIELEPEPDSGLAACLGCGRLFRVEIPPDNLDDDDNPPESPNNGGDNPPNPPQTPNNGHNGNQTGFAPPITRANPPAQLSGIEFIRINSISGEPNPNDNEAARDGALN